MTHHTKQAFGLSFEYFPPQNDNGKTKLWNAIARHAVFDPDFASITYGAGGSTQTRTLDVLERLARDTHMPLAGHLTCADASRDAVLDVAKHYRALGVERIVALRGDGKHGQFTPHAHGFNDVLELINTLNERDFDITVGAYPEPHPNSRGKSADLAHLAAKFDAGAHRAISQFFFEKDKFLRFRDDCATAGITAPIIPGILPIENFTKMAKFAGACGASVPTWLENAFGNCASESDTHLLAVSLACDLIENLRAEGVDHFHIYTLNNPELTYDICTALGRERFETKQVKVA